MQLTKPEIHWRLKIHLIKLTDQNLGDREPHPFVEWFFYSHPSIKNRINAIERFANAKNIPLRSDLTFESKL